ncbi:MAG: hypothetical protein JXR11_02575 [Balneola sp.]
MKRNKLKLRKKHRLFFRFSDPQILMYFFFDLPKRAWEGIRNGHISNSIALFWEPLGFVIKWCFDCFALSIRHLSKIRVGRLSTGILSVMLTWWIFTIANLHKSFDAYLAFFKQVFLSFYALFSAEQTIDWGALYQVAYGNVDSEALFIMMLLFLGASAVHLFGIITGKFVDPDSSASRGTSISWYFFNDRIQLSERYYDIAWDCAAVSIIALTALYYGDVTFAIWLGIGVLVMFWQESFESIHRSLVAI